MSTLASRYGAAPHPRLVPIDYPLAASLVRIKLATEPGTFADDPDIGDPAVALPDPLVADDLTTLAWKMPGRITSKVKLKVTFRKADGAEVAGTFTAYAFVVVPLHSEEVALGATRQAIEKQSGAVAGTSAVPMVLDELGVYDIFGLRLTSITAADATHMFVRAEEIE